MKILTLIGIVLIILGIGFIAIPLYVIPTHLEMGDTIPVILKNDGKEKYANILESYMGDFKGGLADADSFLNPRDHYFNPNTKNGLANFKDARTLAQKELDLAINEWGKEDGKGNAIYHLGMVVHIIQDLTVPHHAVPTPLDGHVEYENWIEKHGHEFYVDSGGLYNMSSMDEYIAYEYVEYNAIQSLELFVYIDGNIADNNYTYVVEQMIPLAQRSGAGIAASFFQALEYKYRTLEYGNIYFDTGTIGIILIISGIGIILIGTRF